MIENEKQEQEEEEFEVEVETQIESEGLPPLGGVSSYIREDWRPDRSADSVLGYVMSALDYITCGKCKGTYVKGDEHDC